MKHRCVRVTIFAVEKQEVLHISVCVCVCVHARVQFRGRMRLRLRVALLTRHSKRMRHTVPSAASLAPPYFFDISHKRHDIRKKSYGS
jgi:hypothetical protein